MTLSQILRLALRQLDEAPEDAGDYDDLFKSYANIGYDIAVREYLKPRERRTLYARCGGALRIDDEDVERVARLWDCEGRERAFAPGADGRSVEVFGPAPCEGEGMLALCEVRYPPMERETDEPRLPPSAQAALAELAGEDASAATIDAVFENFCVGK